MYLEGILISSIQPYNESLRRPNLDYKGSL